MYADLSESCVLSAPPTQEHHAKCPTAGHDAGEGEERSNKRLRKLVLTSQENKSFEVPM